MAYYFQFVKPGETEPTPLGQVGDEVVQWSKELGGEGVPTGFAVDVVASWGMLVSIKNRKLTEEAIRTYAHENPDSNIDVALLQEFLVRRYEFQSWYGR